MEKLRRFIWYLAGRLFLLLTLLSLFTVTFYYAMNATNIHVVLKDGMAKRAQVVMQGEEAELDKYFAPAYLERDSLLAAARNGQSVYQNYYNITGFDHRISLDWFWCWPWEDTARATITERIPAIDGKLKSSTREAAAASGVTLAATPKWQTTQYSVILTRENGQWHIKNMSVIKVLNDE